MVGFTAPLPSRKTVRRFDDAFITGVINVLDSLDRNQGLYLRPDEIMEKALDNIANLTSFKTSVRRGLKERGISRSLRCKIDEDKDGLVLICLWLGEPRKPKTK